MNKLPIFDIMFILITAVFFSAINYFDYTKMVWQFGILFTLIAYFIGKYVGKHSQKSKIQE